MPVDQHISAMLAMLGEMGAPPMHEGTPEAGRAAYLQLTQSVRAPEHTAEFDPLRDEGEAYGKAMEAAGARADVARHAGMIHGFFDLGAVSPAALAAGESCARFGDLIRG